MNADPRIAALAEAFPERWWVMERPEISAAILAALPPDWCGHGDPLRAGAARADWTLAVTDRIAALAEALASIPTDPEDFDDPNAYYEASAAAILAALPPDFCGHNPAALDEAVAILRVQLGAKIDEQSAEIARLRKIEEAARARRETILSLLWEGEIAHHYGASPELSHRSVEAGNLITGCTDGRCPEFVAARAALEADR